MRLPGSGCGFRHVAMALNEGSDFRSPFLHCTTSQAVAWRWLQRGRERRRDYANYIVRIDVSGLPPEHVIDMSTQRKQQAFIGTHALDNIVQEHLGGMAKALADDEVLLVARGRIPRTLMTVAASSQAQVAFPPPPVPLAAAAAAVAARLDGAPHPCRGHPA